MGASRAAEFGSIPLNVKGGCKKGFFLAEWPLIYRGCAAGSMHVRQAHTARRSLPAASVGLEKNKG